MLQINVSRQKGAYFYFPRSIDYPASLSAPHCPCVLRCHYELFQQNPIENIFTHQNEKLVCNEVIWPLFGKNSHILPFFFRAFLISLPISDSARVGNLSIPKFWFTQFLNVNSTDKWIPSDGHIFQCNQTKTLSSVNLLVLQNNVNLTIKRSFQWKCITFSVTVASKEINEETFG